MKIKISSIIKWLITFPIILIIASGFTRFQNRATVYVILAICGLLFSILFFKRIRLNMQNSIFVIFIFYLMFNMTIIMQHTRKQNIIWYFLPMVLCILYILADVDIRVSLDIFKIIMYVAVLESISIFVSVIIPNFILSAIGFLYDANIQSSIAKELSLGIYSGYLGSKANAAYILNLGIAYTLAKYSSNKLKNRKYLLLTFMFIIAMLFTGKRMLLAIAIVMLLFSLFSDKDVKFILRGTFIIILFIVIVAVFIMFIPAAKITFERFMSTDTYEGLNGRKDMWLAAVSMFKNKPLFGYGYGSYQSITGSIYEAHNSYLQLLGELGIVGCLIYGYIFISILVKSVKNLRQNHSVAAYLIVNIEILTFLYAITGNVFHTYSEIIPYFIGISLFYQSKKISESVK